MHHRVQLYVTSQPSGLLDSQFALESIPMKRGREAPETLYLIFFKSWWFCSANSYDIYVPFPRCQISQPLQLHENTLFPREKVLSNLVHATPAREKLEDLLAAGQLEMDYMFNQGINHRSLPPEDVCITLKQLWIFSWTREREWPESERREYWDNILDYAVRGGPGHPVVELFDDQDRVDEIVKWMQSFSRVQEGEYTGRIFLPPRFLPGDEYIEVGGDDVYELGGEDQAHSSMNGDPVETSVLEDDDARLRMLVETLGLCTTAGEVMAHVDRFMEEPCTPTDSLHFEAFDTSDLLEMMRVLTNRTLLLQYKTDLETKLRPFESSEEPDSDSESDDDSDDEDGLSDAKASGCEESAEEPDSDSEPNDDSDDGDGLSDAKAGGCESTKEVGVHCI